MRPQVLIAEAERKKKEEAERKAKLDEIAEKQRQRERELEEKERQRREALLSHAAAKPIPGMPRPSEPVVPAPAIAAASSSGGKYVPRFLRGGGQAPPEPDRSDRWSRSDDRPPPSGDRWARSDDRRPPPGGGSKLPASSSSSWSSSKRG